MSKAELGLYISPELMVLSKAEPSGILVSEAVPVPAKSEGRRGVLDLDFFAEPKELARLLAPVLKKPGWRGGRLVVSLSPQLGLSRYFVLPAIDRKFWRRTLPLEAKKYVPFPLEELSTDYQVFSLPKTEQGPARMGVYFAACPLKTLKGAAELASHLGRKLEAVEPSDASIARVVRGAFDGSGGARALVHVDKDAAYLFLHGHGVPYLSREVRWAGKAPDPKRLDLEGSIEFSQIQLGAMDTPVDLSGSVGLEDWKTALAPQSQGQLGLADLGGTLAAPNSDWPTLAAAGASLRAMDSPPVTVDLAHTKERARENLRVAGTCVLLTALLSGILLAAAYKAEDGLAPAKAKLAQLEQKTAGSSAYDGLSERELEDLVDGAARTAELIDEAAGARLPVTPWLSRVSRLIPQGVWLERLSFQAPMTRKAPKVLVLQGWAQGGDANAGMALGDKFKEGLDKDPVFQRCFRDCELSFSRPPADGSPRTPFNLRCTLPPAALPKPS